MGLWQFAENKVGCIYEDEEIAFSKRFHFSSYDPLTRTIGKNGFEHESYDGIDEKGFSSIYHRSYDINFGSVDTLVLSYV